MITVDPDIKKKYPKAFRAARRERMRVVWCEPDLAYCARRKRGHGQYLVKLIAIPQVDGGHKMMMSCKSIDGEPCQGYQFKGMCVHLAAVIERGQRKAEKKPRKAAA